MLYRCAPPVAVVAAVLTGCGGLDEFEEVIVEETRIQKTDGMIGSPFAPQYGSGFNDIDLSQARTFQNEGVSPDDVDAIYVKSVLVESYATMIPDADRLDRYIESMEMNISAEGLDTVTFATLTPVPMSDTAQMTVMTDFNLKPYAVAPAMTVGAKMMLKEPRGIIVELRTTITLLVDVNILGQ